MQLPECVGFQHRWVPRGRCDVTLFTPQPSISSSRQSRDRSSCHCPQGHSRPCVYLRSHHACGFLAGIPASPGQRPLLSPQTLLSCPLPGSLSQVVAALWPEPQSLHSRLGLHATTWVSTGLDSQFSFICMPVSYCCYDKLLDT